MIQCIAVGCIQASLLVGDTLLVSSAILFFSNKLINFVRGKRVHYEYIEPGRQGDE